MEACPRWGPKAASLETEPGWEPRQAPWWAGAGAELRASVFGRLQGTGDCEYCAEHLGSVFHKRGLEGAGNGTRFAEGLPTRTALRRSWRRWQPEPMASGLWSGAASCAVGTLWPGHAGHSGPWPSGAGFHHSGGLLPETRPGKSFTPSRHGNTLGDRGTPLLGTPNEGGNITGRPPCPSSWRE